MLKERQAHGRVRPDESNNSAPRLRKSAQNSVEKMFTIAQVQKQFAYPDETIEHMLPIAVAYYLFWKGRSELSKNGEPSDDEQRISKQYAVLAMQIYPEILDEIALDQIYQKPLYATNSHDVALYLGVRLAQLEAPFGDELSALKSLQDDVKEISQLANIQQSKVRKSA